MSKTLLAATLIGIAPAFAQPASEDCSRDTTALLNSAYLSCLEKAANQLLTTDSKPSSVADLAFEECSVSRGALSERASACGSAINLEDADRSFRSGMANIVSNYRQAHPK